MIRFAATFCLLRITAFAVPTLPLVFERNMGQAAAEALYVAKGQGCEIRLEARGVSLVQGASTIRMRLDGADPAPQIHGRELQQGTANYLVGAPDRWHTGIPLYGKIEYRDVYPGVDLVLGTNEKFNLSDYAGAGGAGRPDQPFI